MKHLISGPVQPGLPQILPGVRPKSSSPANTKRPFQTVDSAASNLIANPQLPQAVSEQDSLAEFESFRATSILAQFAAQQSAYQSANGTESASSDLKNALDRSGYANGEPPVASSRSANATSTQVDSEVSTTTNDGPGRIVNALV